MIPRPVTQQAHSTVQQAEVEVERRFDLLNLSRNLRLNFYSRWRTFSASCVEGCGYATKLVEKSV